MKPPKNKPSNKRTKKSPIVSVIVEHRTKPETAVPQSLPPDPANVSPVSEDTPATLENSKKQRIKTAKMIATTLGETKPNVVFQIAVIIKKVGSDEALRFLAEAERVEANGGMMTKSGDRRRTVGGVFFTLVYAAHPGLRFHPSIRKKQAEKVLPQQFPLH